MTPRPHFTQKERPLSAIFIGSLSSHSTSSTASPPNLPKLPEPPEPSPGSSSGLPSPPASNSTGSGSVGDESTNTASLRQRATQRRPLPSTMLHGSSSKAGRSLRSTPTFPEDDDDHNDNDEDHTARLDMSRAQAVSKENEVTLQRVKSLQDRNREVLGVLSSFSRSGSPQVPGSSSRTPIRSPSTTANAPSPSPAAGLSRYTTPSRLGSSRSRPLSSSKLQSPFPTSTDDHAVHSGSETERESTRGYTRTHSYSSSDSMSNTPTSTFAQPDFVRPRQTSAPNSPAKSLRKLRRASPSSSRTPRKRASMATSISDAQTDDDEGQRTGRSEEEEDDVTKAALAAVASARRPPSSLSKRSSVRHPLPAEYLEQERKGLMDDRVCRYTSGKESLLTLT